MPRLAHLQQIQRSIMRLCAGGGCREVVQKDQKYCSQHQKISDDAIASSGFSLGESRICFNCEEIITMADFAIWRHEDGDNRCDIHATPSNVSLVDKQ